MTESKDREIKELEELKEKEIEELRARHKPKQRQPDEVDHRCMYKIWSIDGTII